VGSIAAWSSELISKDGSRSLPGAFYFGKRMTKKIIGVVGPCAAGKTTLIAKLKKRGFQCKHIAQEHSYVPDMWKRIGNPDVLIYLDVSFAVSMQRRKLNWTEEEFNQQVYRLRHALKSANMYLQTDDLTPQEVFQRVLRFLEKDP
jgi:deoxyadenosine/deoxycytidine kinase